MEKSVSVVVDHSLCVVIVQQKFKPRFYFNEGQANSLKCLLEEVCLPLVYGFNQLQSLGRVTSEVYR